MQHKVENPAPSFNVHESGSGTPVILIHGLGGSWKWWRHNIDALAEKHRVLALDLRPALSFKDTAAVLARWIETALREPAHIVGNSMGGHLAIHLAAARPDLVRSLTLVNSSGIPFAIAPGTHLENLMVPRGAMSFATIVARDFFRVRPTTLAIAFTRLLRDDVRPLLQRLTMPVLLLWGERDPLVPLTYARQMMESIPNARLHVIPRAGHIPMWENPRAFNEALLEFLRPSGARRSFSWTLAGWTNGMAHREAGQARDIVLVHGLGMSSAYFDNLARALFERGGSPVAPDLPGFGESVDGPAAGPGEHAELLAAWADALSIRSAIWIGHSFGCNVVAQLHRMRPDLVRDVICFGPLWSARSPLRLFGSLFVDAFCEPFALFGYVIRAYWRAGLGRCFATFRRYRDDLRRDPPSNARMIGGRNDLLIDRDRIAGLVFIPGAHACHFAYPEEAASVAIGVAPEEILSSVSGHQDDQSDRHGDDRHDPLAGPARDAE